MEYRVQWIDVAPFLAQRIQPVCFLERPRLHNNPNAWAGPSEIARTGTFWVPEDMVLTDPPPKWFYTITGNHVRVPICAYRTVSRSLSHIFGTGMQIGLSAATQVEFHAGKKPTIAHLFLGQECTDLSPEDAFRCYAGICLQTD